MSRRRRREKEEAADVPMSPLIDCVFLLLIFFLVTTIIKRKEKLIPINLPDMTSQISNEVKDETLIVGIDKNGVAYRTFAGKRNNQGELQYSRIQNLSSYLKDLVLTQGETLYQKPLRLDADRELEFQKAVEILDICKLQGFTNVSIRTRQRKL